ncbi:MULTISPECIES: peptidase C39 family protein [Pseudomonas]|uniref:peptidase C39 family protein n=1 Tax=Pseudomonas TaxID=286 RepID=UPI001BEC83E9|nr:MULTISPECIES: peptidase C39 family protein [Pseudomonas]MBT2339107.1 peptidase C39 family protein [Pseudomonas fluorescens]MCD4528205.1 peptidase C39 family protein [Pseudomonas sp. C3-2018]
MLPVISSFRSRVLVTVCLAALAGCAGSVSPQIQRLPERVELNSVPFYRGEMYQGAPQSLAALLTLQGTVITPGLLEKPLHLPGGEAALQQNMQTLGREYGLVVYPLGDKLDDLLEQVAAGYPVLVRYIDGSAFWAEPRYGILAGYNRQKRTVLLRAGTNRRQLMSFSAFESAYQSAGGWAVLMQRPTQLPANVDSQRWLKAAQDLAGAGQEQAAARASKALGAAH